MLNNLLKLLHVTQVSLVLVLGTSCASNKVSSYQQTKYSVHITKKAFYNLLPTESLDATVPQVQIMSASFGNQQFSSPVYVQADPQMVYFSLLNDFGVSLVELTYSGTNLECNSSFEGMANILPEYIIADFQYCYYNITAIASQLSQQKIRVTIETRDNGSQEIRRFYNGMGKKAPCFMTITKTKNNQTQKQTVVVQNDMFHYQYTLEEAE